MSKRFTALCGLYCPDCIPSNEKLYSTINELNKVLSDLQFEYYAKLKSQNNPVFNDYETFLKVMQAIAELECTAPCTEDGCKENCEIRKCVQRQELEGCWECDDSPECKHLKPLKKIHPNLEYHHELIKEYGTEVWVKRRKHHYLWQET